MKRISILVLLFFSLISVITFGQDYYFYHFKDKMTMKRNFDYILIKFKDNTSNSQVDRVYNEISVYSEKRMDFKSRLDNFRSSIVLAVKIKDNLTRGDINFIENNLKNKELVSSVGMCFTYNDKVLHFTTDEVIVKFKKNVSSFDIQNLNRLYKTQIIQQVSSFENTYLVSVNPGNADNVFDISNKYILTPLVEFAQPNFIRVGMLLSEECRTPPPLVTNDTMLPRMWHIKNTGNNIPDSIKGIPGCDMNIESAWDVTTGNPNVLIAIIDTGIDTNHTDLRPNLCDRRLWYDAFDNDQQPYDEHFHGTGVSGCAVAVGNNIAGTVGVAFNCRVMPVRVFGPSPVPYTTDLILGKGLNWAWLHGACVMNCSWGGGIPSPLISYAIQNAVNYGRNGKGTVVFGGAGNGDTNIVIYPASMPEVIGVGGLSPCNQRKSRTSCDIIGGPQQLWGACYGEGMEIVAPTTYIGTTTLGGGWSIDGNGTSVASPLAAGVGALIISKNINISGDSVKMIICKSARQVGNYSYNIPKEYGLWNEEMGYGRIDARDALDMTPAGPNEIYEQVPPIIKIYPPESMVYNYPIFVEADIYDNSGLASGSNSPRLYYKTLQTNDIQVINGNVVSGYRYRFTFPLIPYSEGLFYYIAAQDNVTVPNFATYPIGGAGVNPPGTSSPPKFMFVRNTSTYDTTIISTDVPIPITFNSETTFVSILNNPVSKTILDINCTINIEHTFDADLSVSLISPSSTEIVLAGGVGWDGNNFENTHFDDNATVAIDSSLAQPPYKGTYKPVEKLWLFDGENSFGEWNLRIVDNGFADGGALLGWNVTFRYSTGPDYVNLPGEFSLVKNYPNPFNPKTRIVFNVPKLAIVKIVIYDITGREVKTVLNERRAPRLEDFVDFDASNLASGVYFYSLIADDNFVEAKKMVFVK